MTALTDAAEATGAGAARGAAWLAIGAVVLGVVLAPPLFRGPGSNSVARVVSGEVEALRDGTWTSLGPGDRIRSEEPLRTQATPAELEGTVGLLSLAPGSRLALVRDGAVLEDGALLIEADAVRVVEFGAAVVRARGAVRVDASPAARVGVYHGGAAVEAGDRDQAIGAHQQLDLVEGRLGDPLPLRYVVTDPWDARLLAGAIAVDRRVERISASLRAVYGTELQDAAFYRDFVAVDDLVAAALPDLAPRSRGDGFGPPAETLVAVVVARLLVDRAGMTVPDAIGTISSLRRDGATWGIVLLRHELDADDLRAAADEALRARATAVADGTAAPVTGAEDAQGPSGDGAGQPPAGEDRDPARPPNDTDRGGGSGDGGGSDDDGDEPPGPADEAEETVTDTVEGAGELLEETVEDAEEVVEEVVDELPLPVPPPRVLDAVPEAVRDRLEERAGRSLDVSSASRRAAEEPTPEPVTGPDEPMVEPATEAEEPVPAPGR